MSDAPPPPPPGGAAPLPPAGWYPDAGGQLRWWDGARWGELANAAPAAPARPFGGTDPRTMAMLAQLLAIFTGFLGPLVIYLVNGPDGDRFVRHHAAEALNFQITYLIFLFASAVALLLLVGIILLPVVLIGGLVLEVVATVAANRGEWYRFPVNLRLVPGAVGA